MKFPIKIIYNHEDAEYCVFVDGIKGIEGYGATEEEAKEDFQRNLDKVMSED